MTKIEFKAKNQLTFLKQYKDLMCVESEEESALIPFADIISMGALPSFMEWKSH